MLKSFYKVEESSITFFWYFRPTQLSNLEETENISLIGNK